MRKTLISLTLVAVVAACNPSAPSPADAPGASNPASALFPDLFQTAYRAEATITGPDGSAMPIVMIRSGKKVRMEMNAPQGQMVTVLDQETNQSFVVTSAMGRQMVIRQDLSEMAGAPDIFWTPDVTSTFTQVGPCSHIGEGGVEWQRPRTSGGTQNTCVTQDGIILWSTDNGRTTWQTTSIQRGAQDAALFTEPAGAQVMDLGNMQGMADALARAKAAAGQ